MKKVLLTNFFKIQSTIQTDKINLDTSVPFLGRSSMNNGIVDYVTRREDKLNQGGIITIALDGSTGSTFYQHHDFCSGQNIWALIPLKKYFPNGLKPIVALFFVTSIRKAVINYSYNLSLTKTRLSNIKILIPLKKNGEIDFNYITKIMNELRNAELLNKIPESRKSLTSFEYSL